MSDARTVRRSARPTSDTAVVGVPRHVDGRHDRALTGGPSSQVEVQVGDQEMLQGRK